MSLERNYHDESRAYDMIENRDSFRFAEYSLLCRVILNHIERDVFQKTCLTCNLFDEPSELCKLAQLRPPARVIAHGCKKYEDISDIPF